MNPPEKHRFGLALLATSIVLSAVGQLFMKLGMQELRASLAAAAAAQSLAPPMAWVACGLTAYGLSMLAWLLALLRYPLSFAYPLLSLSYLLVYVGATQWDRLHETASPARTLGTLLILIGVVFVYGSAGRRRKTG